MDGGIFKNKKNKKSNSKLGIIKTIGLVFIIIAVAGISLLAYTQYTNLVVARQGGAALSAWEDQKEDLSEEAGGDKKAGDSAETPANYTSGDVEPAGTSGPGESTGGVEEYPAGSGTSGTAGGPGIETNTTDVEISKYDALDAEDFFPLKISISRIELEWLVNEGTETEILKKGPGHISVTPLPGDVGRCTISGHRTIYGAPFNRVDELEKGDIIYLETIKGEMFTYIVTGQRIVKPDDVWILEGSDKKELLLTACHPEYSAARRLIIIAELLNIYPLGSGL